MLKKAFLLSLRVHQQIYETTDGLLGHRLFFGIPALLLRTTGRRTGKERVTALNYGRDGDDYLVVASNGGARRPPAWYLNLTARPQVEVQVGRTKRWAVARPIGPDDEDYPRLWDLMNKVNHQQYRGYQKKTDRPIPVIRITPVK